MFKQGIQEGSHNGGLGSTSQHPLFWTFRHFKDTRIFQVFLYFTQKTDIYLNTDFLKILQNSHVRSANRLLRDPLSSEGANVCSALGSWLKLSSIAMIRAIGKVSEYISSVLFLWQEHLLQVDLRPEVLGGLRSLEACLHFKLWQSGVIWSGWVSQDFHHYLDISMAFCWMKAEDCKLLRILKVQGTPPGRARSNPQTAIEESADRRSYKTVSSKPNIRWTKQLIEFGFFCCDKH